MIAVTTIYIAGSMNHPGTTLPANVRGDCGHGHRTVAAAARCAAADDRSCKIGHGPHAGSDRTVIAVEDGRKRPLNDRELLELDAVT